jgi:hypothetical protein
MYYAKYIKYKNKYLYLKYQLGGTFEEPLRINELRNTNIPVESKTLEPIPQTINSLKDSLIGLKVLDTDSKVLLPLVTYNKKFKDNKIYFYRYTDEKGKSYILCSLYSNSIIFKELQKKNVRIQKISIDEYGNIHLLIKNISILQPAKKLDLNDVKKKLMEDLVGIKVLQTNSNLLIPLITDKEFKKFASKNKIHYYTYTDEDRSYILCSLYDYYEFLDILYEHIEIEEVEIKEKEGKVFIMKLSTSKIYHRIHKPVNMRNKLITLPLKKNTFDTPAILIDALKTNPFIIIDKQDSASELLLHEVCMYNLFIGTVHVFVIFMNDKPTRYFLLSLFTEYELKQYIGSLPKNIAIYECRLYKQDDRIEFILYEDMVAMMFKIYIDIRDSGYHNIRYYRGNPAIDNKFLDELDPTLLKKCRTCINVKDIAFNTSLCLLPDKIEAQNHKDILEMEKDFLRNKFELINSNQKIQLWRYNYEELTQLWEYSLVDLEKEVEKFEKELLGLEPYHKELLVFKLNQKGFNGYTIEQILENSVLCYLKPEDKNKRLVYENTNQIDPVKNEFVRNCKFIPEMKRLLETNLNPESELHKYRQTIVLLMANDDYIKKYENNKSYFFVMSWYDPVVDIKLDETLSLFFWSLKLNKLCFQCLTLRDNLIFPFRIVNIKILKSQLSFSFTNESLEFCGYFYTRFTDNYNGKKNFKDECKDKFYFIYNYKYNSNIYSGKNYEVYYYTGNSIWFDVSILPYYKVILCEINWIYYTFILKYMTIPYFYKYINDNGEEEIVVSRYSLNEIRFIYNANGYDPLELDILTSIYYNPYFYKRKNINDKVFVDKPLFSPKEQDDFIKNVILRNNISR